MDGHLLGFASLADERDVAALPTSGRFPDWLRGTLVRNGPSLFEVAGKPLNHWFDGFAMLHAFGFADGNVSYRCRMLRGASYGGAVAHGRLVEREFGTDPRRPWWKRAWTLVRPTFTDNALVNVARVGGRCVALTETPRALAFDPRTLDTLGPLRWGDAHDDDPLTAHPVVDPDDGAAWWLGRRLGPTSWYLVHRQEVGTAHRRVVVRHAVKEVAYQHTMAITARWLVLAEFPHLAKPLSLALSRRTIAENFRWQPERGTRWLVFDKRDGRLRAELRGEAMFAFHLANAWEDGDAIVVDCAAHDAGTIIDEYALAKLRDPTAKRPHPRLRRMRLDLARGRAERVPHPDPPFEFPRCAPETVGRPYRVLYGNGADDARTDAWLDRVLKLDGRDGSLLAEWRADGCFPGEPVQVRPSGARGEDDGVLLSLVLDAAARRSFLVALDAGDLRQIARAQLPHAVPHGFHGEFFAD